MEKVATRTSTIQRLSFDKVKIYMPRIYINLQFLKDLNLDIKDLDLKALYSYTSLVPSFQLTKDEKQVSLDGGGYVKYAPSEEEVRKAGIILTDLENPEFDKIDRRNAREHVDEFAKCSDWLLVGYKHFHACKFDNGEELGDLMTNLDMTFTRSKKLTKFIQRQVLGFWKFHWFKLIGRIK